MAYILSVVVNQTRRNMRNKYVWNVIIWRAMGDEEFRVFPKN